MDIVKTFRLIMTGNSDSKTALSFIRDNFNCEVEQPLHRYRSSFSLGRLGAEIEGRQATVVGLPHSSRFTHEINFLNQVAWMFDDWSERY